MQWYCEQWLTDFLRFDDLELWWRDATAAASLQSRAVANILARWCW